MTERLPQIEQPPQVTRRLHFRRLQWFGVPLLAILPAMALSGLFEPQVSQQQVQRGGLRMLVQYPTRLLIRERATVEIQIDNQSSRTADGIHVVLPREYFEAFTDAHVLPSPDRHECNPQARLSPGEGCRLAINFEAERYWQHQGDVVAKVGGQSLKISLRTLVYP